LILFFISLFSSSPPPPLPLSSSSSLPLHPSFIIFSLFQTLSHTNKPQSLFHLHLHLHHIYHYYTTTLTLFHPSRKFPVLIYYFIIS
jgi:hypothetical protein